MKKDMQEKEKQSKKNPQIFKAVIIDDNPVIRSVLEKEIIEILHRFQVSDYQVYTSDNALEGLGFAYVVDPSLLIIDSTVPKYSGRNVLEYVVSNEKFLKPSVRVIVTYDKNSEVKSYVPLNFRLILKEKGEINHVIYEIIEKFIAKRYLPKSLVKKNVSLKSRINASLLASAWTSDDLMNSFLAEKNLFRKSLTTFIWVFLQIEILALLGFYTLFFGKPHNEVNLSEHGNVIYFRNKVYPSVLKFLISFTFTILAFFLFILGTLLIIVISREIQKPGDLNNVDTSL